MSPLFRNRAREESEAAIRSCDETLAILDSSAADLGPAVRLRARAGELHEQRAYREAIEAARRVKELARLLDRLHTAAASGVSRLRLERTRMARLGIAVNDIDGLLGAADSWMLRTVPRDGDARFPAYSKAGELAIKGLRLVQERVPRFKAASASILEAEQALARMVEANRLVERSAFVSLVLKPAADSLAEAKGNLRGNAFAEAEEIARSTVATARRIEVTYRRVTEAYEAVAAGAKALRSEGGVAVEVEDLLAACRTSIERGGLDEAGRIAERAGARLAEVRDEYRSLLLRLRTTEDAIKEVEAWGFDTREPRSILADARAHLDAGRHTEAGIRVDEARRAAQGLRETHRTTASRISEMRRSVPALRSMNTASAEEAENLLRKAEGLFEEGRYRECEESLHIASLLLGEGGAGTRNSATPAPTPETSGP